MYMDELSSIGGKNYEWQLLVGSQWQPINNDHVIETHYRHPGAKGITINTRNYGQVFIDFDNMQTNRQLQVQRVTFTTSGPPQEVGWYFRGSELWHEYGVQGSSTWVSSILSSDIEYQFGLNPQGSFNFTVGSESYTLNFANMTQTNITTGVSRNVRRRPKFSSNNASSVQTGGSIRWEYMGDEGRWTEYQAHICSLDSAAIERQYQQNQRGQLNFNTQRFSYTLDFSRMCQVNNSTRTSRTVRRTFSSVPTPRWQFLDMDGIWKEFSNGNRRCSVSSQDIELQYQQNPSGTMMFTAGRFSYELNFSTMTQRNLSTLTPRPVQRLSQ